MNKIHFVFLMIISCSLHKVVNGQSVNEERNWEAIQFLSEYIQYPSVTGNERDAGAFFARYCEKNNLEVHYFSQEEDEYNFTASLYPLEDGKPNIILLHHIDVVPIGNVDAWQHDPFHGVIDDQYVWGRGAIDAKGLGVMQLMAVLDILKTYQGQDLPYNITLLCVSDEEEGGKKGTAKLVKNHLDMLNPIVVLGEGGSGLQGVLGGNPDGKVYGVSVAEKASLWLRLELEKVSFGHGATPSNNHANKLMVSALNNIHNRRMRLRFNKTTRTMFREIGKAEKGINGFFIRKINWGIFNPFVKQYVKNDPLYRSLVTNTITVTNIYNPPGPPNKISSNSVAYLDCRLLPGTNRKQFIKRLERLLDEPNIKISVMNESPHAEPTEPEHAYKMLKAAILETHDNSHVLPILFPATTDNSFFRECDIPVYGLIPAIMSQELIESVHSVDERLSFEALEEGIKIYTEFLKKMIGNPPEHYRTETAG